MNPKALLLHPKWSSGPTSLLTRSWGAEQHDLVAVCLALAAPGLWNAVQLGSAQGCQRSKPTALTGWRGGGCQRGSICWQQGLGCGISCFALPLVLFSD